MRACLLFLCLFSICVGKKIEFSYSLFVFWRLKTNDVRSSQMEFCVQAESQHHNGDRVTQYKHYYLRAVSHFRSIRIHSIIIIVYKRWMLLGRNNFRHTNDHRGEPKSGFELSSQSDILD